jgi:hypothetical protein
LYRIWNFRLRCVTRASPASCVYGHSWFTGMSKGGVRQTTVDGLPRAVQLLRRWCWCSVAGMVPGARSASRTYTRRVSKYGPPAAARWLPGVSGTLKFRDGRSCERICWSSMWHRLGVCGVGRCVPVGAHCVVHRWRPYRVECTGSLPTSEVKRRRARLVLGWGTAREDLRVLPAFRLCVRGLLWLFCPRVVGITPRIPIPEAQWRSG